MLGQIMLIISGIILLIIGTIFAIKSGKRITKKYYVQEITVGLIFLSIIVTIPVLYLEIKYNLNRRSNIILDGIINSNLFILICIFITSIFIKFKLKKQTRYFEFPFMLICTLILYYIVNDNLKWQNSKMITRPESLLILLLGFFYIIYCIIIAKKGEELDDLTDGIHKSLAIIDIKSQSNKYVIGIFVQILVGIILLLFGEKLICDNVFTIIEKNNGSFNAENILFNIIINLPILIFTVISILKKKFDLAIGTEIGYFTINFTFSTAILSLIKPLDYVVNDNFKFLFIVVLILFMDFGINFKRNKL